MKNNNTKQGGNYDWFRNGSGNKKAKTPKEHFKSFFKIFKILIYVSLAALSLTGCVQSFVIGTTNYSGQGMELYQDKESITPHVITFDIDSSKGEITRDTKNNYYFDKGKELKEIHSFIETNKGDITKWKTENNAVQIKVDGNYLDKSPIAHADGKPLVASKSQTTSGFESYTYKTKDIPVFKLTLGKNNQKSEYEFSKNIPLERRKANDNKDKVELNFQTATFDVLYQTLFKGKSYANLPASGKSGPFKEGSKEFAAIHKYTTELAKISKITSVFPTKDASTNSKAKPVELDKASRFLSINHGELGFTLSEKNSLRAIYNWERSWKLGPFYGMFVYPISRLVLSLVGGFPYMSGWESLIAIGLSVIIIRLFAYALSFKSTLQQVKQQELSAKKAAIEAKYEQYKGNKQMEQRKRQELAEMFKKEGVSPLGSIGSVFLTMPIFLAMWKIIGGIPHLKSTSWLGIHFSETSWRELFHGSFQYLPLMLTAAIVQGISIYIPRLLTKRRDKNRINAHQKAALKKSNKTQNIMMAVFVFMALIFSAGLQIYWIFGGLFTIAQNCVNHQIIKYQSKRKKLKG